MSSQRQIAGRRDPGSPVNPQQQMIMKVMPWFLPIISVGFPAGLNLYFVSSNIVRVGQQAVITRRIYKPHKERQALIESVEGQRRTRASKARGAWPSAD